jgi:hypothetical protein
MPEESIEGTGDRNHNDARREARRREQRWWKGGLIAALVFLGLATLYNGIAYRRLVRAQQKLTFALMRQRDQSDLGHMGPLYRQGFGGRRFPIPLPGVSPNYGRPGWGWHPCYPNEQEQQQKQVPSGQSTPGQ